ncbi:MAG: DUF4270 domain-containing protein [Bacteroidales bacterium]|nr:DUF4270 domain-containing protein [Bacteroidales bacterium]
MPIKLILIGVSVLFLFVNISCKKVNSDIGTNLQNQDQLTLHFTDTTGIRSTIAKDDSVTTDERSKVLLGSYNDAVFGLAQASFATQFRLSSYDVDFGTNPVIDSLVLYLNYVGFYGDTTTSQEIKIFQMAQDIFRDSSYYSNEDMTDLSSTLAQTTTAFSPNNSGSLNIKLDDNFGTNLIADSGYYANNDTFLTQYKGLYITTTAVTANGAIIYFDPISENTKMTLYYHNDSEDSLSFDFLINENCAYFNIFSHDYTGTSFENDINQDTATDDIYIQAMGGVKAKIDLDELLTWKDSGNIAINKAELVLTINDINSDMQLFAPPERLLLEIVDDIDGFDGPIDYFMDNAYFDGYYDETTNSYSFNIARHVQEIITGEETNSSLYIFPESNKVSAERTVLSNNGTNRIKLNITYTKFK